jgi:hypothetical protein
MASQLVFVTGLAQLDAKLAQLEPKLQKKFTRKALRAVAKKVVDAIKAIIQVEAFNKGVLYKAFKVRALKRSRGRVGVSMFVDREKLFADYTAAYGHPPNPAKGDEDPFYYLAAIEYGYQRKGGEKVTAIRPMRRGLYDNAEAMKQFFIADIQELISEAASAK